MKEAEEMIIISSSCSVVISNDASLSPAFDNFASVPFLYQSYVMPLIVEAAIMYLNFNGGRNQFVAKV